MTDDSMSNFTSWLHIFFLKCSQFKKAFRRALTCSESGCKESPDLTNQSEAPAGSSMRHRKQEHPSLNDPSVAVVSSITGITGEPNYPSGPVPLLQRS